MRLADKHQPLIRERTSEFDWIAVRPVERSADRTFLLLEDTLHADGLDGERPGARDRRLFRSERGNGKRPLNVAFSACSASLVIARSSSALDWVDAPA